MGGINYLINLIQAIQADPARAVTPVLLVPPQMPAAMLAFFAGTGAEVLTCPPLEAPGPIGKAGWLLRGVIGQDPVLGGWLQRHGIAAISHSLTLGSRSPVKSLAWIPDFQHVALPHLFSDADRRRRDRNFRRHLARCDRVIVSSHSALADLQAFSPRHAAKGRVLHFVADVSDGDVAGRDELAARYRLDRPWFFLPNQFWAHKNHRTAIRAVAHLAAQGAAPLVVATGAPGAGKDGSLRDDLAREVEAAGIGDAFRMPGVVPRRDLIGLMTSAQALINPSLFEGWSSTVEEAKSLGKQLILSDIPVHREQAAETGLFFDPANPLALAARMTELAAGWSAAADARARAAARAAFPARQLAFAERYRAILAEVCPAAGAGREPLAALRETA